MWKYVFFYVYDLHASMGDNGYLSVFNQTCVIKSALLVLTLTCYCTVFLNNLLLWNYLRWQNWNPVLVYCIVIMITAASTTTRFNFTFHWLGVICLLINCKNRGKDEHYHNCLDSDILKEILIIMRLFQFFWCKKCRSKCFSKLHAPRALHVNGHRMIIKTGIECCR